jgi:hypothetical protein
MYVYGNEINFKLNIYNFKYELIAKVKKGEKKLPKEKN